MRPDAVTSRRILVVEDDYLLAIELTQMLKEAGAQVIGPAPSVAKAMSLIEAEQPDAAVLDVNLNGELSLPIADELIRRNVPFLFATGYDAAALPQRYRDLPCSYKPVDVRMVHDLLAAGA